MLLAGVVVCAPPMSDTKGSLFSVQSLFSNVLNWCDKEKQESHVCPGLWLFMPFRKQAAKDELNILQQ